MGPLIQPTELCRNHIRRVHTGRMLACGTGPNKQVFQVTFIGGQNHWERAAAPVGNLLPDSQYLLWRLKKYAAAKQQLILNMKRRSFHLNDVTSWARENILLKTRGKIKKVHFEFWELFAVVSGMDGEERADAGQTKKNVELFFLTYLFTQVNRPHASLQIVPNDLSGFTAVWITGPENGI